MEIKLNPYDIIVTIITLCLLIWGIYSRIKYLCLKKASEEIARVEKIDGLNKQQRFALVVTWIDNELPKVFKNSLVRAIIEKIVNYVYNYAYKYAQNYIKRKTGFDISTIIKQDINTEITKEQAPSIFIHEINKDIMHDVIVKNYMAPD